MSAMDGFINFFIFDFTHPFREEIGTCIRYIHKASRQMHEELRLKTCYSARFFL